MSSDLSILNAAQKAEFLELWEREDYSTRETIATWLMVAITKDGGPQEDELFKRQVINADEFAITGTKYRVTWSLRDLVATDTYFTIVVGTSWELASDAKAVLGREIAKQLKADMIPRVKISYCLCSPPRR
ncbi:hypothetical protein PG991_001467 [Apiospora marii]|uniref:Uncharacterized protein n=1 Tax=Apiospora marii TaxID=335849 RepID=A0ABR1SS52_9PEZI